MENAVNLEDVEMADSVGKQASLVGSLKGAPGLAPGLAPWRMGAMGIHGSFVSSQVDRERKKKKDRKSGKLSFFEQLKMLKRPFDKFDNLIAANFR